MSPPSARECRPGVQRMFNMGRQCVASQTTIHSASNIMGHVRPRPVHVGGLSHMLDVSVHAQHTMAALPHCVRGREPFDRDRFCFRYACIWVLQRSRYFLGPSAANRSSEAAAFRHDGQVFLLGRGSQHKIAVL